MMVRRSQAESESRSPDEAQLKARGWGPVTVCSLVAAAPGPCRRLGEA